MEIDASLGHAVEALARYCTMFDRALDRAIVRLKREQKET